MGGVLLLNADFDLFYRPDWRILDGSEGAGALAQSLEALLGQELRGCTDPLKIKLYKKLLARPQKVLATLLLQRGVKDAQSALDFLSPGLSGLHPPQALPDMEKAVKRLKLARQRREKVLIHGDYDADGITATALLVMVLKKWGLETIYYLPHRLDDGYGLSSRGITWGAEAGCTLLVTVDCGVSDPEQVELATNLGLDVIITDHHQPPSCLPRALAIINPQRADSPYPFPDLAGVGVAWKLASVLTPEFARSESCLQLVALGTVADQVPLVEENRILVKAGLEALNTRPLPGLAALAELSGRQPGHLDSQDIAFALAPRLNAAGRMDSAEPAAALLLAENSGDAARFANYLDEENRQRRKTEEQIFSSAVAQAELQAHAGSRLLVLHGRDWHAGVIGIVASRILERFLRPAIVLSGEKELTGSARSIEGYDIHDALKAVSPHLLSYGGHPGAAGLVMAEDSILSFRAALEKNAEAAGLDSLPRSTLCLEAYLEPEDITMDFLDTVALLRPFGCGNPEPLFAVRGFSAGAISLVGADKRHLRLRLEHSRGRGLWAIGFGKSNLVHSLDQGKEVQVAAMLHLNRWQGKTQVQLQFNDVRGPKRRTLGRHEIVDRRGQGEPWLGQLAADPGTLFVANTLWRVRQMLPRLVSDDRVLILPPDKAVDKVYNLKAREVCFLDPAWGPVQLHEFIALLSSQRRLHFFGGAVPEPILCPSLNLLRSFYRRWRNSEALVDLLSLLPLDLAEPLLLERILGIFAEVGLAGEGDRGWELKPFQGNVDLTETKAWRAYGRQLNECREWLRSFQAQGAEQLLAAN